MDDRAPDLHLLLLLLHSFNGLLKDKMLSAYGKGEGFAP